MNKRKEHVIQKAHELFIEKGYHATSIQDILNHSRISKGSFYNYFPSKGDLFKAVFTSIHNQLIEERDALLIGEDLSDIDIFIKQVNLIMKVNRLNKIHQLVEDALVSNDPDLILFIKKTKFSFLTWVHERFIHIFAENKKPYLLDGAVVYTGMLQGLLQANNAMNEIIPLAEMIDYCTDQIQTIVDDVTKKDIQLFSPDKVDKLMPESDYTDFFNNEFSFATLSLKKTIEKVFVEDDPNRSTNLKLLFFIQEEIMNSKEPRVFLIESALLSLKMCSSISATEEFMNYHKILTQML